MLREGTETRPFSLKGKARMLSRMPGLTGESGIQPDEKPYLTWRCPVTPSRFSPERPLCRI